MLQSYSPQFVFQWVRVNQRIHFPPNVFRFPLPLPAGSTHWSLAGSGMWKTFGGKHMRWFTRTLFQFPPRDDKPILTLLWVAYFFARVALIGACAIWANVLGPTFFLDRITINGVDVADSQLAIEYLCKHFSINMNKHLTKEEVIHKSNVQSQLSAYLSV
jgi:hypothetical protein